MRTPIHPSIQPFWRVNHPPRWVIFDNGDLIIGWLKGEWPFSRVNQKSRKSDFIKWTLKIDLFLRSIENFILEYIFKVHFMKSDFLLFWFTLEKGHSPFNHPFSNHHYRILSLREWWFTLQKGWMEGWIGWITLRRVNGGSQDTLQPKFYNIYDFYKPLSCWIFTMNSFKTHTHWDCVSEL
jgi:hypothetical protein